MRQQRSVFLSSGVGLAAIFFLLTSCSRSSPSEILIVPVGTTNGFVGFTNGSWTVYCVTNQSTNSFFFAGAKIELKTDSGWITDPALTPTEIGGWVVAPTREYYDGSALLTNRGSFHIFFNTPEHGVRWRASLRFLRNRPSAVPTLVSTNPAALAGVAEEALSILDHSAPYDCPVPEMSK